MSRYARHMSNRNTPVSEKLLGRNEMVPNSTGGYVFALDKFARLERFLILGTEGGTYYSGERKLTRENAQVIWDCVAEDPQRTVQTIVQISDQGRCIKNDTCVFALAMVASSGNAEAVSAALAALNDVCRIGTHLFQFVGACDELRGWGRGLRKAVSNWYLSKSPQALARQVTKYAQREGWSHRDVLRLAHPTPENEEINDIFQFVAQNETWAAREDFTNPLLEAFHEAKSTDSEKRIIQLINESGLEREHIPTTFLNSPAVWRALLPNLRQTALIRNLGKLTSIGVIKPLSRDSKEIAQRIADPDALKRGRVHPFSILLALKTYEQGGGYRGNLTWNPDPQIIGALDDAFYMAFDAVEPTGKNFMFGIDVSGSMTAAIMNTNVSCRAAAGCLAMTSIRREPNTYTLGFCHELSDLKLTPRMSLADVERRLHEWNFGSTNPSLLIRYATQQRLDVDTFVIITDNEVNRGQHNTAVLDDYRQKTGNGDTKLVVVGMTATGFSIADPNDPRQLDIVGFDASGPQVISEFSR